MVQKPVQKLRDRIRAATAEQILNAAEECVAERGLHETHMGDIAASAGMAVGTLYNHFADKDALLAALLETRRQQMLDELDAAIARSAHKPFREQLHDALGALFSYFEAHRRFMQIAIRAEAASQCELPSSATLRAVYLRLEQLAARGLKKKALRPEGAELYPAMLIGMVRGMNARDLYAETDGRLSPHVEMLVDLFLEGAARAP
jgi:AcrR family transcriptional regulator